MSVREKTVRRIVALRQRLRDAAGAQAQAVEMERTAAMAREQGLLHDLQGSLTEGIARVEHGAGVRALWLLDETRLALEAAIVDAHGTVEAAELRATRAREVVRQRERELRTTERKLEQVHEEQERRRARAEQRTVDDLSPHRGGHP